MAYRGPEHVTQEALRASQETHDLLSQWASTAHRLVEERIQALMAADPDDIHVTETPRQFAERVHAKGQHPFPDGYSIYSDLNCNTGYDYVEVSLPVVVYSGFYPVYDRGRDDFDLRIARIRVPAWLITGPDGEERFRAETAEMVAAVKAKRAEEKQKISALVDKLVDEERRRQAAERATQPPAINTPEEQP